MEGPDQGQTRLYSSMVGTGRGLGGGGGGGRQPSVRHARTPSVLDPNPSWPFYSGLQIPKLAIL